MKRRPRKGDPSAEQLPPELETFRAEDWPSRACHAECAYLEAITQWREARPDWTWPLDFALIDEPWHPERI